ARAALKALVADWIAAVTSQDDGTLRTTRALLMDAARRRHIAARLEAERQAFISLIKRPHVRDAMADFLARRA
ncbi:MAG: hypothetical protein D6782_09835, partial [Alphaproteobacteria bacterium]